MLSQLVPSHSSRVLKIPNMCRYISPLTNRFLCPCFNKGRMRGNQPSGRSASFFPLDKSILGSSKATQSTTHDARVTFWNVDIDILTFNSVHFNSKGPWSWTVRDSLLRCCLRLQCTSVVRWRGWHGHRWSTYTLPLEDATVSFEYLYMCIFLLYMYI